ncbi:MAG: hypothetical protein Q4D38_12975 [Planctomycetia bacterium]|nr:hypothetical protein [Planctomycetia bacterium]
MLTNHYTARSFGGLLLFFAVVLANIPILGQEILGVSHYTTACTTAQSKREILQKIQAPYAELSQEDKERVSRVLKDVSIYRRLPLQIVSCDEELYHFASRHPDVIVNIWELMKVSKMTLREVSEGRFYMEDQAGTRGLIQCIYRSERLMLLYATGIYEGPPFPRKVKGRGLVVLQNLPVVNEQGERFLAIRLDAFMQIENNGVDALAKTFQPVVGRVADHNFAQVAGFLGQLSKTSAENGFGVAAMSERLTRVPVEVQQEFAKVAISVMERADAEALQPLPVPVASTSEHGEHWE